MSNSEEKTFNTFDKLGRQKLAEDLTEAVVSDAQFYEDSYVLSLNGSYGTGKTTFIQMWMNWLNKPQGYSTAYVNAWENDYIDEPLLPIMYALKERLKNSNEHNLDENFKKTIGSLGLLGNQILKQTTGVDLQEIDDYIQESGDELFEEFSQLQKNLKNLKNSLEELVKSCKENVLFIFVDELDRAKPDYAVKFLERIKHIFNVKGVIFVLAVHKEQLLNSMKTIYGEGLDCEGYYRRFITQEASITLPENLDTLENYIKHLSKKFLDIESPQHLMIDGCDSLKRQLQIDSLNDGIMLLSQLFHLSLRDLEFIFKVLRRFTYIEQPKQIFGGCCVELIVMLVVLSIKIPDLYTLITEQGVSTTTENLLNKYVITNFPNKNHHLGYMLGILLISFVHDDQHGSISVVKRLINDFYIPGEKLGAALANINAQNLTGVGFRVHSKLQSWKKIFNE